MSKKLTIPQTETSMSRFDKGIFSQTLSALKYAIYTVEKLESDYNAMLEELNVPPTNTEAESAQNKTISLLDRRCL
ncbi:hypothetical protein [Pseudolactococcus reticulitermitis]|uniref:Uncharacterized protein n=1 Tax=Pseudolactococcus reticulitermitis TaxID=2025039 RepID=A0A224XAX7_9LACT|nr:hypothetical protein [Lactococcus reticulitermitis]GAX47304.1 hypothetical protein RsY01_903 [Lactococcus reticulitermitis]